MHVADETPPADQGSRGNRSRPSLASRSPCSNEFRERLAGTKRRAVGAGSTKDQGSSTNGSSLPLPSLPSCKSLRTERAGGGEITILIVDDEPGARAELRAALRFRPGTRVVGEAGNVAEAIEVIARRRVDLVMLEVNLPIRSGFELLPHLPPETQVIVVTAVDSFALKAFEYNVVDYVLKPLRPERLHLALERIWQRRPGTRPPEAAAEPPREQEIILQSEGDVHVVAVPSIAFIKAVGNYTQVHVSGGRRILVRKSMESWQAQLPVHSFRRPHRSLIVNLRLMQGVMRRTRDRAELQFRGHAQTVQVGRRATSCVQRALKRLLGEATI